MKQRKLYITDLYTLVHLKFPSFISWTNKTIAWKSVMIFMCYQHELNLSMYVCMYVQFHLKDLVGMLHNIKH